jgi:hypothetical protein
LDRLKDKFQMGRELKLQRTPNGGTRSGELAVSATEVEGIHASTLILFAWVGIPLLQFHPHPSQCRSIG